MNKGSVPYAQATAGGAAREETSRILKRLGCSSVAWMDEWESKKVLLAFKWRGQQIQLEVPAGGWAAMYLRENPWTERRKATKHDYEQRAMEQGMTAASSILRDWVKGQVMAIECGMLKFEHIFLPYMITNEGDTIAERIEAGKTPVLLPVLTREKKE